ncbi:hypothetical protein [Bacillus sp. JCM 19034]|uniref:hypothetical protein n=1 Tax=Bacillus sp. JCM 19034 TaxID=1481928 RepID=UPI000784B0ED|nr:hypothetical protein [Bacillus sp. JCM 19034]
MAFGISRSQLKDWKNKARRGEIAFLTHYWLDDRFPDCDSVTKVACTNKDSLIKWGKQYGLKEQWIHEREEFPHYDLLGEIQREVLMKEGQFDQLNRLKRKDEIFEH